MIWYYTYLFSLISYIDLRRSLISGRPPEVIDIWERPPGSSEDKRGLRMELEHQKTYDLIPKMTHLHWFNILTLLEGGETGGLIYLSISAHDLRGSKNMKTCLISLKLLN